MIQIDYPERSLWSDIVKRPVMNTEHLFDTVRAILRRVKSEGDRAVALATLASMDLPEGLFGALAEILTAFTEA